MSDRTYAQLRIYALPDDWTPEDEEAVRDAMTDLGFETEADGYDLRAEWTVDELRLGEMDPLAATLAALGVTFEGWEDPKYEWLGVYYAHVPGLGVFSHDCDASGNARFTVTEVQDAMALPAADRDRMLGIPWEAAIAPLREKEPAADA